MIDDPAQFVIIGGGPAGALLANYLGKAGIRVDVYEMRPDPRISEVARGKSINLALSFRGLSAMEPVGLTDRVLAMCVPMRGRMIHPLVGKQAFQSYGVEDRQAINSVSRGELNRVLVEAAANYPTVRFFFGVKCSGVDFDRGAANLVTQGGEAMHAAAPVIIGADGAFSAVRRSMQRLDRFDYSQSYLSHGYKELTIPAGPGGTFQLEKNALHIWPRKSFMMIALPNADGSFTCTLFWPFEGENSFAQIRSEGDLKAFFERWFPDALPLFPDLGEQFFTNPTGSMVTITCRPWHAGNRVLLMGDAAHAVVPFYGQGMNAAFEDVLVFDECRRKLGADWAALFREFEARRKPHTDCLAKLAVENFLEMRDKTASRIFRSRKKIERLLGRWLKPWYIPLYTLVTFTRTPYADAVRKARRQNTMVILVAAIMILAIMCWLGVLLFEPGDAS